MTHTLPVTGNTERTKPENRAFYPALDGIRALAFVMVFAHHYAGVPWGWAGVNIFFVLSGFLITGILFDSRDDPHRARNFYVRRTLRIFPLYYAIFLVALLLQPLLHWHWSAAWIAWPLYLGNFLRFLSPTAIVQGSSLQMAADGALLTPRLFGMTFQLGHFWTLCIEEQFYLVWPWFVFYIRSRRALIWVCAAALVISPLLRIWAESVAPAWMLLGQVEVRITPFQLDSLLLGGLVALLWRGPHRDRLLQVARALAIAMTLGSIVSLAWVLYSQPHWFINFPFPSWTLTWGFSLINIFSAAVIVCGLRPGGLVVRLFSPSPLRWLGRISYGAYVYHDIFHDLYFWLLAHAAGYLVRNVSPRFLLLQNHLRGPFLILSFAMTLLISWLSFRFFEAPFLNLKERWTIRGTATPPPPS